MIQAKSGSLTSSLRALEPPAVCKTAPKPVNFDLNQGRRGKNLNLMLVERPNVISLDMQGSTALSKQYGGWQMCCSMPINEASYMSNLANDEPVVCVVDDDSDIRSGLKALLESVGIACICFSSTKQFLESSEVASINCLILDVRLPGLGGLDLQDELARLQIKVPIIFITAHADVPMSVKAMKAGAMEFLTKPFREQDILDAVRLALERDRMRRSQDRDLRDLKDRLETLSEREREVMKYVVSGLLNKQTAARLRISEVTVKVHRHNLIHKMGAKSLPELVRIADMLGISRFEVVEQEPEDQNLPSGA